MPASYRRCRRRNEPLATERKMKSIYTLAIIAAVSLVSARADVTLSPRAHEASSHPLTAKGSEVRQSFAYVGGKAAYAKSAAATNGAKDRNLVSEQRSVIYTGKTPFAPRQIEIAPVR